MMTREEFHNVYTDVMLFSEFLTRLNYRDIQERTNIVLLFNSKDVNPMISSIIRDKIKKLENKYITD